jgi:hypothetical protein
MMSEDDDWLDELIREFEQKIEARKLRNEHWRGGDSLQNSDNDQQRMAYSFAVTAEMGPWSDRINYISGFTR